MYSRLYSQPGTNVQGITYRNNLSVQILCIALEGSEFCLINYKHCTDEGLAVYRVARHLCTVCIALCIMIATRLIIFPYTY